MGLGRIPVSRALISVHDKTGLLGFCRRLNAIGVDLISSGGTAAALADAGLPVTSVSDLTGFPEILGGRVKTLHPRVHGAILARPDDPSHRLDLDTHEITPIDLVVSNLYPFEEDPSLEQIDIGGVALTRAAAKNHEYVGVVVDPSQYDEVASEIEEGGLLDSTRLALARRAFLRTADYDAAIAKWLQPTGDWPDRMHIALEKIDSLRYGENPHQTAAAYAEAGATPWWRTARFVQGKELSFNNLADAEAAWRLVSAIEDPAVVIVKHANPCGVAIGDSTLHALRRAWECDPLSAFGGVVALNRTLDPETAHFFEDRFVEVIVTPEVVSTDGIKPSVRVLAASAPHQRDFDWRRVEDGFLVQDRDVVLDDLVTVSEKKPAGFGDLRLAVTVVSHTRSNAIVIVDRGAAVGIGAGDQSRVGAVAKALRQAGDRAYGAVAASEAFFPFPDALEMLAAAGVVAVVAPGGSRNDQEIIDTADRLGIAFVRSSRRHFRH